MLSRGDAGRRSDDPESSLPVLVDLAGYLGNLTALVDGALGLLSGSWRGLSGPIRTYLDGLDVVPRGQLPSLTRDLAELLRSGNVSVVITCRGTMRTAPP
jgi:hypothetical protein